MDRRGYLQLVGAGGGLSIAGCSGTDPVNRELETAGGTLRIASGTTPDDSGLFSALHPGFEDRFGASVDAVVRGTGGALRTARDGDCDLVLVHARPLEDEFLRSGFGLNRRSVMVNDFLVVGPPDDRAGIAGLDPIPAFREIAGAEATFVSRGDGSGTHVRERRLWDEAGVDPAGAWYVEVGQGMGQTLQVAAQQDAYTLADRGSFLNAALGGALEPLVDRGIEDPPPLLRNEYAVIPVNPARHDVAYALAMAYVGYVTGPGQSRIQEFRIGGDRAFRPAGLARDPDFQQYVPADWSR